MSDDDIDAMYERDMDMRIQALGDEWWADNPKRAGIELEMAEQERYFKTIRGKIFFWRFVERVSWWKTFCRVVTETRSTPR